MTVIPTLQTARLRLRPMTMNDWPSYQQMMASDRSSGMGGPLNMVSAWGMFCHDMALWAFFGHGALMIEHKDNNGCLGQVGINDGPLFPEKELGWFVYSQAEGKGYAFEAASALRDWALGTIGIETLVSYIDADNARSIKLAERLGGVLDPLAPRTNPSDLVFRHAKT